MTLTELRYVVAVGHHRRDGEVEVESALALLRECARV